MCASTLTGTVCGPGCHYSVIAPQISVLLLAISRPWSHTERRRQENARRAAGNCTRARIRSPRFRKERSQMQSVAPSRHCQFAETIYSLLLRGAKLSNIVEQIIGRGNTLDDTNSGNSSAQIVPARCRLTTPSPSAKTVPVEAA